MTVSLLPLDCPSCGSAMRAEPLDVLFLCQHCGQGAVLGKEGMDLVSSSALLPAPSRRAELWRPAWLLQADVAITERVRAGGLRTPGWHGRRTFVIPAFDLPLTSFTRLATALSRAVGETGEVPHEPVTGGILSRSDALVLARHMILSEEIGKPDMLAAIDLKIEALSWRLVATPYERKEDRLHCAITGVSV